MSTNLLACFEVAEDIASVGRNKMQDVYSYTACRVNHTKDWFYNQVIAAVCWPHFYVYCSHLVDEFNQ